jgi:iron complex outermembrane receptor protein
MGLEKTYFQLNVYNLFDQFYVGGFGGGLNQAITTTGGPPNLGNFGNPPFVQIGAPRTISATLTVGF